MGVVPRNIFMPTVALTLGQEVYYYYRPSEVLKQPPLITLLIFCYLKYKEL